MAFVCKQTAVLVVRINNIEQKFYRHFWSEDSMIVGTGFENKNAAPSCCPRGTGHSKHGTIFSPRFTVDGARVVTI